MARISQVAFTNNTSGESKAGVGTAFRDGAARINPCPESHPGLSSVLVTELRIKESLMNVLRHSTWLAALLLVATASVARAQTTIKIDFNSTAKFTESDNTEGTATKSGVTDAQKALILKKVQEKYDNALGAGKVTVSEGTGGDVDVILNGSKAPGALAGNEYGDAGKPGKPGVVHLGEFKGNAAFNDDTSLSNAVGESIAHEAGHKLGLSHNWEANKLMTEGSKVKDTDRAKDSREFTADDTKRLQEATKPKKSEGKDSTSANDLGVTVGQRVGALANKPDDRYLDAYAWFQAPTNLEFGYTSDFVPQGDWLNTEVNPTFMTFLYHAGVNLGVLDENTHVLYTLEGGQGSLHLSNPNPDNPSVFQTADAYFLTDAGSAHLTLNATIYETTGGFNMVPEPATLSLLLLGVPGLIRRRRA